MEFTYLKLLSFFTKRLITSDKDPAKEKAWRVQSYAACVNRLFYLAFFVLYCALWLAPHPLSAQETSTAETTTNEISIDEINIVARELWCPLCSGVRLDVCELQACDQMREQIGIQLANDASVEQIKTYFIEQYGPQVLGEPPWSGFNWLAWVVPVVALAAGALLLLQRGRAMFASADSIDDAATNFDLSTENNGDNEFDTLPKGDGQLHSSHVEGQVDDPSDQYATDQYADALDKELNTYE